MAGIWSGYRKKALRLLAGASAGGLWTCILAVFPVLPRWAELLLTYGLVGPVMGRLAFPIKGTGNLFRFTAVLSVISIFTGGLISQLYLHTGMGYAVSELLSGGTLYGVESFCAAASGSIRFSCGKRAVSSVWEYMQKECRFMQSHPDPGEQEGGDGGTGRYGKQAL